MRARFAPLILATLASLVASAVSAAESISKYEVRRAPAARVEREVLGQLADIIKPTGPEVRPLTDERPVMPLTDMWFETEPRNTEAPGLCRYDTLIMEFEPTGEPGTGADTRVHASGFTAQSQFAVIAPPAGTFEDIVYGEEPPPKGPSCAGVSKAEFFAAPDAETAFDGILYFNQAVEGAKDEVPAFSLTCDGKAEDADCRKALVELGELKPEDWSAFGGAAQCEAPDGLNNRCLQVTLDNKSVRMVIVNGVVSQVTVTSFLILSHARRD